MIDTTKVTSHGDSFTSERYEEILNSITALNIVQHVKEKSVFNFHTEMVSGNDSNRCFSKKSAADQMRLLAMHATVKGGQLAGIPLMLWGDTYREWKSQCFFSKKLGVLQFMTAADHLVSMNHLRLFYVCVTSKLFI
jgi:hypothetical protein